MGVFPVLTGSCFPCLKGVMKMFVCEICGYEYEDDEMSDDHDICMDCKEDEELVELIALDII